jgi:hypothetical protein
MVETVSDTPVGARLELLVGKLSDLFRPIRELGPLRQHAKASVATKAQLDCIEQYSAMILRELEECRAEARRLRKLVS